MSFKQKLIKVEKLGGFLNYISSVLKDMLLPELCTLFSILFLIYQTHKWLKLTTVELTWDAISRYELRFLPVIALSFFCFNPITQTVRYFLESPYYFWAEYWNEYILHTYRWKIYFVYLLPVLLIGYIALNISLLQDYLKQRDELQKSLEAKVLQKAVALSATFSQKLPIVFPYLNHLKGRNSQGDLDFPVNDVYYFTIEDRAYYAELDKGRYLISKTLNELENELNPAQFFRIKRDYIVNRQAVLGYTHWENGKYNVRLNTPSLNNITIPRNRMYELREWLQGRDAIDKLETADMQ